MDYRNLRMKKNKRPSFQDWILHEDEALIVINKPSGISSLADREEGKPSIHELAKAYWPDAILCHRLDKYTTGVMLIAKSEQVYRHITLKFQKREIHKTYLTLVEGRQNFEDKLVNVGIYNSGNGKVRLDNAQGKPASTFFSTKEHFRHYTLLECRPITGRMHQIRLHLLSIGLPVVGDKLYLGRDILLSNIKRGYKPALDQEEKPINHGFLLHAHAIEFMMPGNEALLRFEAPLSAGFEVVLKLLRRWDV
jgi:RluA family pseudouridine synthase